MAFGFEFPHTHNYDSDLREVLHYMKQLEAEYNNIENLYEEMRNTLDDMSKQYQEILNYYYKTSMIGREMLNLVYLKIN